MCREDIGYERNLQKCRIKSLYDNKQEEPLPAGGSCLLGSINLAEFVNDDKSFNFTAFAETVEIAVRFLNEILDEGLALHPLDIQQQTVRDWRQIGLGIMGLADMLIKMEIPYGSKESIELCDVIGYTMIQHAIESSVQLAKEYGPYPKYNKKVLETDFINYNFGKLSRAESAITEHGLRNSQLLTCAPTGTLSTMLGISGGIEPIFANYYTRKTESLHGEDVYYKVYTPIVDKYMKEHNITDDKDLPSWFVTSSDLDFRNRIEMQSIWQSHIDASISSTINLPQEATVETVELIYTLAHEKHLKGVTIYRSGCKREGILVADDPTVDDETNVENSLEKCDFNCGVDTFPRGYIIDPSDDLIGYKRKLNTGCGAIHLEVYADEVTADPQETFINIGSGGGCERNYQFISRLISLCLRGGIPIEAIIDQAMSIRPCTAYINRNKSKGDTSPGTSCPSAIGCALNDLYEKYMTTLLGDPDTDEVLEIVEAVNEISTENTIPCPECGESLIFEGGCNVCKSCGHSKCD